MLDDAKDHQKLQLEVLELLLHHGADPNEIYTPVRFKALYERFMLQMWDDSMGPCLLCMHDSEVLRDSQISIGVLLYVMSSEASLGTHSPLGTSHTATHRC